MVKVIRFPLEMEDGIKVRTLEELKENFSIEKVMLNYANGKLLKWLIDRGYDTEAKKIKEIDNMDEKDIPKYICKIFEVKYDYKTNLDIKKLINTENKINILKNYIKDETIIEKIDSIAFNQEELVNILSKGEKEIYLCNNTFEICLKKENISYIGIGNPIINLNIDDISILNKKNIKFKDITIKNNDKVIDINEINTRDIEVFVKRKDNKIILYGRDKVSGEEFTITDSNEEVIAVNNCDDKIFIKYNNKIVYFIKEIRGLYKKYELIFRDLDNKTKIKISVGDDINKTESIEIAYLDEKYLVFSIFDSKTYLFNCKTYEIIEILKVNLTSLESINQAVLDKYFIYLKEGRIYIKDIINKSLRIAKLDRNVDSISVSKKYIYYVIKAHRRNIFFEGNFVLGRIDIINLKNEVLGEIGKWNSNNCYIKICVRDDERVLWTVSVNNNLSVNMFNINKKENIKLSESYLGSSVLIGLYRILDFNWYCDRYFNE